MFAEVAVHTPLARHLPPGKEQVRRADSVSCQGLTFHYAVPPALQDTLKPGHLVWVPFGKQQLHGVVLELSDWLPPGIGSVRPILDLALPEPVCTPAQLALARWLSSYYLAPILDCVLLMLPPGLAQKAEPVLTLTAAALRALSPESTTQEVPPPARPQQLAFASTDFESAQGPAPVHFPQFPDLKPEQHALLALLLRRGQVPERIVERQHPELVRRSVLDPLIKRGLVSRQRRIVEPPLRPKTGKLVTLVADWQTVEEVLPRLGRASKQAEVLSWLANYAGPPPSVAMVCQQVGCSPAPVQSLAERGWVRISRPRRLVELLLTADQVQTALAGELRRAPAQAAALQALQEAARAAQGPVEEDLLRSQSSITTTALAALEKRGYVRRWSEEATVQLLVPRAEIPARVIELKGGQKYRRVLEALAAQGRPVWVGWLYAEADVDLATLRELARVGLISLTEKEIWRDPLAGQQFVPDRPPTLTADQMRVWREIEQGIKAACAAAVGEAVATPEEKPEARDDEPPAGDVGEGGAIHEAPVYLLHGVTGSGKTEIYLRAIDLVLKAGRQAIVLVPEIALTPQTIRRFVARFGERATIYHSDLSAGERYDVWRKARAGEIQVVVGTRSALFLPMPRLGLIVLDEEHDPSYKEAQRPPRYHAREAALQLARLTGAVVILGSATPALETYHAAQMGHMRLLEMPRRIMGHARAIAEQQERLHLGQTVFHPVDESSAEARYAELPPVQVVDLRQELRAGNRSMFSRALQQALTEVLEAGQQAILFFNRRGSASFVICRDCGHVLTCEQCHVPLTYHEPRGPATAQLVCHHCGQRTRSPERCPECQSRRIRYLGAGTEKIAALVEAMWPQARVVRWDRDVTGRKGSHDAILRQFLSGQANVMVGTQMIAKGLDLPLVTLVGVISADVGLYLPDFRAAERSFQLLTQVAGRAGRSLLGGRVIIQSYRPEHYAIQAARRHDYLDFYRQELSFRRQLGYPPFRRLIRLVYAHKDRQRVQGEAEALAHKFRYAISEQGLKGVDLIGPAPCFFSRVRGRYRWQVIVRAAEPRTLLTFVSIPRGWRIDVDPINLL